jgi:hydrogenase-4 component F
MSGALALIVVALPFISAMVLAMIASWRIGAWINTGSASLQFIVAFPLAWRTGVAEAHLALLTSLVAMTVSWFDRRDVAAALAGRSLNRQRARFYHVGYQVLIGAIQGATLANDPIVIWLALVVAIAAAAVMTGAARDIAASAAASRLMLLCGIGLMLALLGTLLIGTAPELAGWFLLLGYAGVAGMVPLQFWSTSAAAEGVSPGAVIVTTLLPNVPMLLFMRLSIASGLLIAFGLASLLVAAVALWARLDWRRSVALAGMAQLGMVVFAVGIAAKPVAWLHLILLGLARSAVLQSRNTDMLAWLTLALLPLYALYLLAEPTVAVAALLLVPLAAGVLLVTGALVARCPTGVAADWATATPVWLQLAIVALLAFAVPALAAG